MRQASFCLLLFLTSCGSSALVLHEQRITPYYLASTHVGSPDPRTPPKGEMVVAEWWLSKQARDENLSLVINVLYRDFTTRTITFPIQSRIGYEVIQVVNEEFEETGGFLAYRAEIVTPSGEVFADWKHQLWVKLISVDEKSEDLTDRISSAVDE